MNARDLLNFLAPPQGSTSHSEKIVSAIGGFLGIALAMLISGHYLGFRDALLIGGAMGASAVLLFAVPHSPLAQPWAFVGGHMVSTLCAIAVYKTVPNLYAAGGLAVAGSILLMAYLRCIHPPGGGTALAIIVGSPAMHTLGFQYAITPIGYNLVMILAIALLFNNLTTRRWYPLALHQLWSPPPKEFVVAEATGRTLAHEDLAAALKEMDAVIDVTEEDLEKIYALASVHAHMRRIHGVSAADVMRRDVVTVAPNTALLDVWNLMQERQVNGVAVVDAHNHGIGMITISDFLKQAGARCARGFPQCLIDLLRRARRGRGTPRVAEDLMSAPLVSVREETDVIHLLPIFARKRFHHLPVVDAHKKIVGLVTLPALLAVLHDEVPPEPS